MRRRGACVDAGPAQRAAQREPDARTDVGPAVDGDVAAHALDQAPADDEADARALDRAGLQAQAVERGEKARKLCRGHAPSRIGDLDDQPARIGLVVHLVVHLDGIRRGRADVDGDVDAPVLQVVLDRVADHVDEHLAQPRGVGLHAPGLARQVLWQRHR